MAMAAIMAETIRAIESSLTLAPTILCSLAAHVEDGEPVRLDRGAYTRWHRLAPDLRAWFKAHIGARTGAAAGRPVEIEFVHDCDVAACALAVRPNAAVLMLGSSPSLETGSISGKASAIRRRSLAHR
jgi:hypothetical protein